MRRVALLIAVSVAGCTSSSTVVRSPIPSSSAVPTQQASPTPVGRTIDVSKLRGVIAVSSETRDVWVADADGSHARRITHARAQEFDPTWSPDGSQIAYRRQMGDDTTTEVWVMKADGSHQRPLTHNKVADWGPDWSPGGGLIVWNSAAGTGGLGFFATTARPDGAEKLRLSHHYVEYPAWSPDGSAIAFMAQEPGASGSNPDYNIFVMNADGSDVRRLTTTPGEDGWPAWSQDGSRIVFSSSRDDCSVSSAADCRKTGDIGPWMDVWAMNADGSDQHRVTFEFGQFFAWSPDGRSILVAGASSLYVIRHDGTGESPLPIPGVEHPLFPDWVATP